MKTRRQRRPAADEDDENDIDAQESTSAMDATMGNQPAVNPHGQSLDELDAARDRSVMEFLRLMDNVEPVVPDAVTDYYLMRAGVDCPDVRIKRLMALAAQKFVADIAQDAYQYAKLRQQSSNGRSGASAAGGKSSSGSFGAIGGRDKKTVLTVEDLSAALLEYGINVKRPEYYV